MSSGDELLVQRAQVDPAVFGQLYERYIDRIYSYIYYRIGSVWDAEDLTSLTFVQALTNLNRYTDKGTPFSAWLYRIAHNLIANWHRDHGRHPSVALDETLPVESEEPVEAIGEKEEHDLVRRAVAGLPPERQHLLLLKFVEGLSNAAIGKAMGRSEGAIKQLLHRTLANLRTEMDKLGHLRHEFEDKIPQLRQELEDKLPNLNLRQELDKRGKRRAEG